MADQRPTITDHEFVYAPRSDDPLGQFCDATAPWGRCGRPFDVHPSFAMAPGAVGLAAPRPAPHPSDRGEAL